MIGLIESFCILAENGAPLFLLSSFVCFVSFVVTQIAPTREIKGQFSHVPSPKSDPPWVAPAGCDLK